MGCFARVGCLILLVILGVVAWLNRDRWYHRASAPGHSVTVAPGWYPLSDAGAKRTRDALEKLSSPRGPVFVTLGGSDVASYIMSQIAKQMPASSDSFAARITDDRISVRASMRMSELGKSAIGVLGSLLGDREPVEMSGTLRVLERGMAEFQVTEARIRGVSLPSAVISRLVAPLVHGVRPKGLDENALPISIPTYIGDVRIANGRITLYKNVQ